MKRRGWVGLFLLLTAATTAAAAPLNLALRARVTATGTERTFLGLWPRETDDAPYTVRDGDLATGWKAPAAGQSTLTVDLAPFWETPPLVETLYAQWEPIPAHPPLVRVSDFCGGEVLFESPWTDPLVPLRLYGAVPALCVELVLDDPGTSSLTELHLWSAAQDAPPAVADLVAETLADGVRLTWSDPGGDAAFVEVHYLLAPEEPFSGGTLLARAPRKGPWEGPRPAFPGVLAAVVAVAADGTRGEPALAELPARERPIHAESGVVEGFYGRPWSFAERRSLVVLMARLGLGVYVYGPKNDLLHRDLWRVPYGDWFVEEMGGLLDLGARLGVTLSLGISPGRDMDLEGGADRMALVTKLSPFVERGFRHFTLLLDDIQGDLAVPVDGLLGARHAALANWMRDALEPLAGEPVTLWVVPTVYATSIQESVADGDGYLDALADLAPGIQFLWTGNEVFSPYLEARDLAEVTRRVGRPPILWDNEHATDGGDGFVGKVYLAPYSGRAPDLAAAVRGIVANPMILGGANRLVLPSYAAYLDDPFGYDPDEAAARAAEMETVSVADRATAGLSGNIFFGSGVYGAAGINLPIYPRMNRAVDALRSLLPDGDRAALLTACEELLFVAAEMAAMQDQLHHGGLDPSLVDDLWVPADRLTDEGRALLFFLDYLGSQLAGRPDPLAFRRGAELLDHALLHDRYQLSLLKNFTLQWRIEGNPLPALGFAAPALAEPERAAVVGEVWTYPAAPGRVVSVFGLPGAGVEAGTIRWVPPHPGRFHAIVTAQDDGGWAWRDVTVIAGYGEAPAPADDDAGDDAGPADGGDDASGCGM